MVNIVTSVIITGLNRGPGVFHATIVVNDEFVLQRDAEGVWTLPASSEAWWEDKQAKQDTAKALYPDEESVGILALDLDLEVLAVAAATLKGYVV